MRRHCYAIPGLVAFFVLVAGTAACAAVDEIAAGTGASGQFGLGFEPLFMNIEYHPVGYGLHLAYYTQFGLFAEVCGGTDAYGEGSFTRLVLGYNYNRDETVEYFAALGALSLRLDEGRSLNPVVLIGYHTSRFPLGPPGEYAEVPNMWHSYYLGYAFGNLDSGGDPDLGNFVILGYSFEYRF